MTILKVGLVEIVVNQVLSIIDEEFRCELEDDGSEIMEDVLHDIFDSNKKVGIIMILTHGEDWTKGNMFIFFAIDTC